MPQFEVDLAQLCCLWNHGVETVGPNSLHVSDLWINTVRPADVQIKYSDSCIVNVSAQLVPISGFNASQIALSPEFVVNSLPEFSPLPDKIVLSFDSARTIPYIAHDYPTANVVKIALVNSSIYPKNYDYTESVTEYFSNLPVLVKIEDVISIPLTMYDQTMILQQYPGANSLVKHVSVKVIAAEIHSKNDITLFFINTEKTTMYQVGICKDRLWRLQNMSSTDYLSSADNVISVVVSNLQHVFLTPGSSMPFFVLKGQRGSGRRYLVNTLAKRLGFNLCSISAYELFSNTAATMEEKFRNALRLNVDYEPCVICLENIDRILTKNIYGNVDERVVGSIAEQLEDLLSLGNKKIIVFATITEALPFTIQRLISRQFDVGRLSDGERRQIIVNSFLSESSVFEVEFSSDDIDYLVRQTVVYLAGDLVNLVHKIMALTTEGDDSPRSTNQQCFDKALKSLFKERDDTFNVQTIQKVNWSDVGGLSKIIEDVRQTIQLATESSKLLPKGIKMASTGGILLYGPPGTGKTLLAKAVATECSLNFISVKGPELVNMYVGKSEENVRELFARLRSAAPCVLFCDELDSLAPRRGWSADSGGVMDRLVAQLATEMDALSRHSEILGIILIGATNRPDLIDPALLRPGRFDRMFYVGGNSDKAAQLDVLFSLTRNFSLDEENNGLLEDVVEHLPNRITGADIYAVCTIALQKSFRRLILDQVINISSQDSDVRLSVSVKDFQEAASELEPSVTEEDFSRYDEMKEYFSV